MHRWLAWIKPLRMRVTMILIHVVIPYGSLTNMRVTDNRLCHPWVDFAECRQKTIRLRRIIVAKLWGLLHVEFLKALRRRVLHLFLHVRGYWRFFLHVGVHLGV